MLQTRKPEEGSWGSSKQPPSAQAEDDLTHVWRFFDPQRIEWMRDRYAQVEKQFFV
jgi:hypothetical protein